MAKDTTTADTVTAAQALIGAALEAALEARRKAWFGSLDEALTAMAGRVEGVDLERLPENETVLSMVAAATRLALETHDATKLATLRNMVLNTAAGTALDDVSQAAFLRLVDRFSDLHIRILRAMANPLAAPEIAAMDGGGVGIGMEWGMKAAFLPFAPVHAIIAATKDLKAEGLIQPAHKVSVAMLTKAGLTVVCITPAAERFLRFIGPPVELQ